MVRVTRSLVWCVGLACCALVSPVTAGPCPCDGNVIGPGGSPVSDADIAAIRACSLGDCTACAGDCDVNCDGVVDVSDVSAAVCQFGAVDPTCCTNDVVGACCINNGSACVLASRSACINFLGGRYQGDGAACLGTACDCDMNGMDDLQDVRNQNVDDCNRNRIPDRCEIPAGSPGGTFFCNVPSQCESDCNNNGVIDSCDIEICTEVHPQFPQCDDCNLNGLPDMCDLGAGTSQDFQQPFGVPDECITWDGGGGSTDWNNPLNWNPDVVPNDAFNTSVTISGPTAFVDLTINAVIQSLRVLDQATLRVAAPVDGDLFIADPRGAFIRGQLFVAQDRVIDVSMGKFVVGSGGTYRKDPSAPSAASVGTSTVLVAGSLTIMEGAGEPPGEFILEDKMKATITGDVLLDGTSAFSCDLIPFGPGCTPPLLKITGSAKGEFQGKLTLKGETETVIKQTSPSAAGPLGVQIDLSGDFENDSTVAQCFDWETGGIRLLGGTQRVEAVGQDAGPVIAGLVDNFAIGRVEIATGTNVTFSDLADNDSTGQGDAESIYIETLLLESGSSANIAALNAYYLQLNDGGGNVTGSGQLIPIGVQPPTAAPLLSGWSLGVMAIGMVVVALCVSRRATRPVS